MSETPKRRWSFSLRTLFLLLTVFGCVVGFLMRNKRLADQQRVALEAIRSKSSVGWSYEWGVRGSPQPEYLPRSLVNWLGEDFFGNIVQLEILPNPNSGELVSEAEIDEIIPHLKQLPALKVIHGDHLEVSAAAMQKLRERLPHVNVTYSDRALIMYRLDGS